MKTWIPVWVLLLFCLSGTPELQAQWIPSQGIEEAGTSDVVVLDSTVFICTENGIYSRNINGGTWQQRFSGIGFYRMETCGNALFAWGNFYTYRSLDHGNTWQDMAAYWSNSVFSLCTIDSTLFFSTSNKVFRSDDYGNTIYPIVSDTSIYTTVIKVTSGGSASLFRYKHPYDYLFESTDKGMTWDTISMSGLSSSIEIQDISRLNGNIWLSSYPGVYLRNDIQQQWVFYDSIYFTRLAKLNGTLMACASNEGVYRLDPALNQWFPENAGLETLATGGFCACPGGLFLATSFGPYKCTTPYIWVPFYDGLNQADISALAFLGNEVWTISARGTFVSTDHGATFTKHEMTGFSNPTFLLLTDSLFYALTYDSVWISSDHGNSWVANNNGLPSPVQYPFLNFNSLVRQGGYLFLGTNLGLYRSPCQNINWTKMTSLTYQGNHTIYLFCDDTALIAVKEVYASNYYYYTFRSTDSGLTFDSVNLPVSHEPAFATNGVSLYAGTYDKIFKSSDEGFSWSLIPTGLPELIWYFLAARQPAVIAGGTYFYNGAFLFATYDDGSSWTDIWGNLPLPLWNGLKQLAIDQERTFVSPRSNGLWYQDGLLTGIGKISRTEAGRLTAAPNPAKASTTILFDLPEPSTGKITVTGMTGRILYQGITTHFSKGRHREQLDLGKLIPGLYIVYLHTDKTILNCKLLVRN